MQRMISLQLCISCHAVKDKVFFGVTVDEPGCRDREINRAQFYQALYDSINVRLAGEGARDQQRWQKELSPEFGEQEVKLLCSKYDWVFRTSKINFMILIRKMGNLLASMSALKYLINCTATIPVTTAEFEREFSRMNIVCSSMRSKLAAVNLAALMFVSMNGPPLRNWNALPYVNVVKSWLARDRRDATHLACPKRHQQS